jgi:uncharacterized RDD family membrane protein YckC
MYVIIKYYWIVNNLKTLIPPTAIDQIMSIFSYFLMIIVCIVAFFTQKRQALHDIVAKTLIFKR